MSIMDNVQPAVKKETGKVAAITGIGLILMWIVFGVLHAFMPLYFSFFIRRIRKRYRLIIRCFLEGQWEDVWQSLISFLWDLQCRKQLQQQMRTQRE